MENLAVFGYILMVFGIIYSILLITGVTAVNFDSIVVSIFLIWIWGLSSGYLLWKREIDGLFLSIGFITFTTCVALLIYYLPV